MAGSAGTASQEVVSEAATLCQQGWSIPRIAKHISAPYNRTRNYLIESGVEMRSRADGVRIAENLGSGMRGKSREFTPEWKAKIAAGRTAWGDANAAGVSVKPSGYIEVTRGPNKGRLLHDVLMEEHIGRPLAPDEVVHHKDRNKENNKLDNLLLLTNSEHARLHRLEDKAFGITKKRGSNGRFC